jgi:cytochrome P450
MGKTIAQVAEIPAHVPGDLVWDHDISSFPSQFEDPYIGLADTMHRGPDIVWAAKGAHAGKPGWLLTRFADMEKVVLSPAQFTTRANETVSALLAEDLPLFPFESDPPEHRHYRAILQPWFLPGAVNALDRQVRDACGELIGKFERVDGCEFVTEFSSQFPSRIFLAIMGMPVELLGRFLEWENSFLRGPTAAERVAAIRAIYDYLRGYLASRRGQPGDDLVGAILSGRIDGRELSEAEALGMCMLLYIGGLDTVANSLAWQVRHLAGDPTLQARLVAEPTLIPAATEEMFRLYGVNNSKRTVAEDTEFGGVAMCKGDVVALPTYLASRDPRVYQNPHDVEVDRKQRYLTFGLGIHFCLGFHLAKREVSIALAELLSHFPNIRIAQGQNERLTTERVWGVKRLPLTWDP